jgi:hypothetical protein
MRGRSNGRFGEVPSSARNRSTLAAQQSDAKKRRLYLAAAEARISVDVRADRIGGFYLLLLGHEARLVARFRRLCLAGSQLETAFTCPMWQAP